MDIITNDDWEWVGGEYRIAYATTSDPRVVAVIEREDEYGGGHIDGDAYAPAFYFERGRKSAAGSTFTDAESDEIAEAWATARYYLVNRPYMRPKAPHIDVDRVLARYMRCFFGTTVAQVRSSIDQGTEVTIFNTPSWREYVGITDEQINRFEVNSIATYPGRGWIRETVEAETEEQARAIHLANHPDEGRRITVVERESVLAGNVHDWQAALDGDVYGIGWATNVGRVLDDTIIDLEDGQWTQDIQCWGFLGEEYAQREAAEFGYGEPDLEPMLELDEPGFVEHTDRMAELSARDAELADRGW